MSDSIETTVGGAKVVINPADAESPSAEIVRSSHVDVVDADGRTIRLKRPGVLPQFRLVEALGNLALNQVYMSMVLPLIYIVSIDGQAVAKPGTKGEVEALISRLDEAGVEAVMNGVAKNFAPHQNGDDEKND